MSRGVKRVALPCAQVILLVSIAALVACPASRHDTRYDPAQATARAARTRDAVAHLDTTRASLAATTTPLTGFALLDHEATLHASEAEAREALAALTPLKARDPLATSPTRAMPFLIEEDRGDVVRLATLPPESLGLHCARALPHPLLADLALSFWTPKRALLPVLASDLTRQFSDKTAVSLATGTPVWPSSAGDDAPLVAGADGVQLTLSPDEATIALAYSDPSPFATTAPSASDERLMSLPDAAVLWLDGRPALRASELATPLRQVRQQRDFDAFTLMVALASPCARLAALTPTVLRESGASGAPAQPEAPRTSQVAPGGRVMLRQGKTLTWPDGTLAATARRALILGGASSSPHSVIICFDLGLKLSKPLCISAEEVEFVP